MTDYIMYAKAFVKQNVLIFSFSQDHNLVPEIPYPEKLEIIFTLILYTPHVTKHT